MPVKMLVFCSLFVSTCVAQFGEIVQKSTPIPDTLTGGYKGFVDISYFVNDQGKIFLWELSRICVWDSVENKCLTVYGVDPKIMEWSELKLKFVPVVKAKLHYGITPLGKRLSKALADWLTRFTKETEFRIADTSMAYPLNSTTKRFAYTYTAEVEFGTKGHDK